jgi:hypothetical protein
VIYIVPGSVRIFPCSGIGRLILEILYINLSQIYESRNWETEHYNSVLQIVVSFLGIHKWEPDIYIGFSPALHLQCRVEDNFHGKRKQEDCLQRPNPEKSMESGL